MGATFNKQDFEFKDSAGNTKFSISKRMPHIIFDKKGTFSLDLTIPSGDTNFVSRKQEIIVLENEIINNQDYLIMPSFIISGGISDSADSIVSGGGSIFLRILRKQSDGKFVGSAILSTIVEKGVIKFVIDHNLDRTEEYDFRAVTGDVPVTVNYRIYYGRFR